MSKYFSRTNRMARRAIRSDTLSKVGEAINADRKAANYKLTTQNAGPKALELVRDIFDNYTLPSRPKFGYSQIRSARHASNNKVEAGVITISASFMTRTGVNVNIDVPVEIRDGEMLEPSVVVYNGAPRVIAQSTFDSLTERNSTYEDEPLRKMYGPPMTKQHNQIAIENRRRNVRVNRGLFASDESKSTLRDIVAGKAVKAQQDGTGIVQAPKSLSTIDDSAFADTVVRQQPSGAPQRQPGAMPKITPQTPKQEGLAAPKKQDNTFNYGVGDGGNYSDLAQQMRNERLAPPRIAPVARRTADDKATRPCLNCKKTIFTPFGAGSSAPSWQGHFCSEACKKLYINKDAPPKQDKQAQYVEHDYKKFDPARNSDDSHLDPAEREEGLAAGDTTSLSHTLEIKDRGGATWEYAKGSSVTIVRDLAGDGTAYVVEFEDGCEAIVESSMLKAAHVKTADAVFDEGFIRDVARALSSTLSSGNVGSFDDMSGITPGLLDTGNMLSVIMSDMGGESIYREMSKAQTGDATRYADLVVRLLSLVIDILPPAEDGEQPIPADIIAAIVPLAESLNVSVAPKAVPQQSAWTQKQKYLSRKK